MKTKKVLGYGIFTVITALAFTACKEPAPAHVHDYEWTVTAPATCIATGKESGVCKLDPSHTTTREIPIDLVNGHDYGEWTGTVTCETAGTGTRVCSRKATHTETNNNLQPLGHNYQDWTTTTDSTCTTAGVETGTCTRDQATTTRPKAIDPNAHNWQPSPSATAPTCTEDGNGDQICSYNEAHIQSGVIPKLGHAYGDWIETTAPTCTVAGVETRTCSHDVSHKETQTKAALGHDSGTWHTTLEPDCTTAGSKELRCTRDNVVLNTESIIALGHDYQNWTQTTAPTCTTTGIDTGTCTHDNSHSITRAGAAALGHNWGEWTATTAPTTQAEGEETRTCSRCDETEKRSIPKIPTYTVTFNINGGSGTVPSSQSVGSGSSITLPDGSGLSRSGYIFGGWNINTSGTGTNYSADSEFTPTFNITLYAKWNLIYTVTFNINSGSGTVPSSQSVGSGSSITLPNGSGISRSGYTFGGWNTNTSGTGTNYSADSSFTPTGNITLYARWLVSYTVTFVSWGSTVTQQTVGSGMTATRPSDPNNPPFSFGGWYTDAELGQEWNFNNPITANRTFHAKWQTTDSDPDFVPGTVISQVISVLNDTQLQNAVSTINSNGNNKNFIINVGSDISLGVTPSFSRTNITVAIRGTGVSGNRTIARDSMNFSDLSVANTQKVILRNINLRMGVTVRDTGTLEMKGTSIIAGESVNNYGTFIMSDNSVVRDNVVSDSLGYSAVYSRGTFIMRDNSAVRNNQAGGGSGYASYIGGGVQIISGTFTMQNNAAVSGNSVTRSDGASIKGGGVYVTNGTFIMQDNATVSGNSISASYSLGNTNVCGGGVYLENGTFIMQDNASVSNNSVSSTSNSYPSYTYGGGVYVDKGTFTMRGNAYISGNIIRYPSAVGNSGGCGVYVSSGGTFRIAGGTIYGGTFHIEDNTSVLDNGSNSNRHYSISIIVDSGRSALHNDNGTAAHGVFNGNAFTQRGILGSTSNNIIVVNGNLQQ